MLSNTNTLISISSNAICDEKPFIEEELILHAGALANELINLLTTKNGFYAFESALHVYPAGCSKAHMDINRWNAANSWRKGYDELVDKYVFFAEDIFGCQYAIANNEVIKFDPEIGESEIKANCIEEWASTILHDYDYETGHSFARDWQQKHSLLPEGQRLIPKKPFVLGGGYEVENLYPLDSIKSMDYRSDMWKQIRSVPDGGQI